MLAVVLLGLAKRGCTPFLLTTLFEKWGLIAGQTKTRQDKTRQDTEQSSYLSRHCIVLLYLPVLCCAVLCVPGII